MTGAENEVVDVPGSAGSALVVGTGRMARLRISPLRAAGLQVTVTGRDPARSGELAAALSVEAVPYPDAASRHYDCVLIASSSEDHLTDLQTFLGCAPVVLCEKPVAASRAETEPLRAAVRAAGAELYVGFQRRFDPTVEELHRRVQDGDLGDLLHVRATDFDRHPGRPEFIAKSGGMFRDLVIHDLDWLMWTTGQPVRSVHAFGSALVSDAYRTADDCDTAVVTAVLGNGTLATINAARAHPLGQDVRMELLGTRAALSVGLLPATPLTPLEDDATIGSAAAPQSFIDRFGDAFRRETHQFARYVTGQSPAFAGCTLEEAITALVVAEACDDSWRSGRPVRCDPA